MTLKRALRILAVVVIGLTALLALSVWLIARDEVTHLRSIASKTTTPLAPLVRSAILAAEDPILIERPRVSLGSFLPPPKGTLRCGPSPIAYVLVRSISPRRRPLRWHIETAVTTHVVTRIFSPETLLRIYAHELYLGTIEGQNIRGVESASNVYFGKATSDLTPAEAATLAAMIRAPNVFSPVKHPARTIARRDQVLARMLRLGFIDRPTYQRAIDEPLRTRQTA